MTHNEAVQIKEWIKTMGFKLTKSHSLDHHKRKIKYYTLGNFGVYEQTTAMGSKLTQKRKFTSWTPWGEDIEVHSVKDLWVAYEDFEKYNPSITNPAIKIEAENG